MNREWSDTYPLIFSVLLVVLSSLYFCSAARSVKTRLGLHQDDRPGQTRSPPSSDPDARTFLESSALSNAAVKADFVQSHFVSEHCRIFTRGADALSIRIQAASLGSVMFVAANTEDTENTVRTLNLKPDQCLSEFFLRIHLFEYLGRHGSYELGASPHLLGLNAQLLGCITGYLDVKSCVQLGSVNKELRALDLAASLRPGNDHVM